jgi:hypothetical protein
MRNAAGKPGRVFKQCGCRNSSGAQEECDANPQSAESAGWIKNHFAYCQEHVVAQVALPCHGTVPSLAYSKTKPSDPNEDVSDVAYHKAYAAYSRAIGVARARNQSAWLQRALFMRAGLLVAHRRLDSAQRDLLASVAAQEDIRAAALDAAGRIAAGGPAAAVYEYAADRLLAAPLEPPDPAAVSTGGAGTALAAFALTELARSRELVYHLATAGELGPDADPDPELAERLDADLALRERIADLRARLDAAPPEEQPALADELRAARAERDRIWADVESDESDLAALRAGRPAAYPEVRDILADGAR